MNNKEKICLAAMLEKVMKYGILVALDDFGMGNSTLTLLRDIPVTSTIIDHSFVRNITGDHSRKDNGNLAVLMRDLGADYLQGYYFSKPIPVER